MPKLRVLAGPSASRATLVSISDLVNTFKSFPIKSEDFEGFVSVHIKGFVGDHNEDVSSPYFDRPERRGVTWSIQVR